MVVLSQILSCICEWWWSSYLYNTNHLEEIVFEKSTSSDNHILTLENLALKKWNMLLTMMCVLCHTTSESANHLLLRPYNSRVWNYFNDILWAICWTISTDDQWAVWSLTFKLYTRKHGISQWRPLYGISRWRGMNKS